MKYSSLLVPMVPRQHSFSNCYTQAMPDGLIRRKLNLTEDLVSSPKAAHFRTSSDGAPMRHKRIRRWIFSICIYTFLLTLQHSILYNIASLIIVYWNFPLSLNGISFTVYCFRKPGQAFSRVDNSNWFWPMSLL